MRCEKHAAPEATLLREVHLAPQHLEARIGTEQCKRDSRTFREKPPPGTPLVDPWVVGVAISIRDLAAVCDEVRHDP
jgi:hypothetical protein